MVVDFSNLTLKLDGKKVDRIGNNCEDSSFKFVGHHLDEFLTWDAHINLVLSKLGSANYAIAQTKKFLPLKIRTTLYNSMFKSHLDFGSLAFGCAKASKIKKIVTLQKKCIRHVKNVSSRAHSEPIFDQLKIIKFQDLFKYNVCIFMNQYRTGNLPSSFDGMFSLLRDSEDIGIRDSFYNYKINPPKSKSLNNFPRIVFLPIWNSLSSIYQSTDSHKHFKNELLKSMLSEYEQFIACDNILCVECRDAFI